MKNASFKWDVILTLAERLGVSQWTRTKWRQRGGVPARWHLPLIMESGGALGASDFMPTPESKTTSNKEGAK